MKTKKIKNKKIINTRKVTVRDFSKKAIQKSITRDALRSNLFQYSLAIFGGSMIFGAIAGFSEPVVLTGLASVISSVLSFTYIRFFHADKLERNYIEAMRKEIEMETEEKREKLSQGLTEHNCEEGVRQFMQLTADYENLIELITAKINPEEITYQRYYGMVQEVFLSGIDNLRKILEALISISEINEGEISSRVSALEKNKSEKSTHQAIYLKQRLSIRNEKLDKINLLLLENEKAITILEQTASTIADMDTGQDEGKIDIESSMKELLKIASKVEKQDEIKRIMKIS